MPSPVLTSAADLDLILDACFELSGATDLQDLSRRLEQRPLDVLRRIADSVVMDMIGLECSEGSEQEAEFFGLALAGVPLRMALQWCSATSVHDDRPTPQQLESAMSGPDLRPGLARAAEAGLCLPPNEHLDCLVHLGRQTLAAVLAAARRFREDRPCARRVVAALLGLTHPGDAGELGELDPAAFSGARRAVAPGKPWPKANGRGAGHPGRTSKRSKRNRWGGRQRGPSYPAGAPIVDRRTAAEKAWESRTHW